MIKLDSTARTPSNRLTPSCKIHKDDDAVGSVQKAVVRYFPLVSDIQHQNPTGPSRHYINTIPFVLSPFYPGSGLEFVLTREQGSQSYAELLTWSHPVQLYTRFRIHVSIDEFSFHTIKKQIGEWRGLSQRVLKYQISIYGLFGHLSQMYPCSTDRIDLFKKCRYHVVVVALSLFQDSTDIPLCIFQPRDTERERERSMDDDPCVPISSWSS